MQPYHRLSFEEREEIAIACARGDSLRTIAHNLHRAPSTIAREVRRCSRKRPYRASAGHFHACHARKSRPSKLSTHPRLYACVLSHLRLRWSPAQIAHRIRLEYPEDTTMRISPETIYTYLYILPKGALRKELLAYLRQKRKYRRLQKTSSHEERRGKMGDLTSITERPLEVADRTIAGHWEGDLLLGYHKHSALGSLVERTTRFTLLVPLTAKDAHSVRRAFARTVKRLPAHLAKTLTYDQGKEMAEHRLFTEDTKMQVYFAHPSSPWERGTNENTNGLIRQYFPKGTDFTKVSKAEILKAQAELNNRPRKVLGWKTPNEVFTKLLR